jgi:PiT family inorganic phosphate transporter
MPVSTTHALAGALAGASIAAAGFANVKFAALGSSVLLPLVLSPPLAAGLTMAAYPAALRLARGRDCLCVDGRPGLEVAPSGAAAATAVVPAVRWAAARECNTGAEAVRWNVSHLLHWVSAAGISLARGLNDTPKIAALLLVAASFSVQMSFTLVALMIAGGGLLGAVHVAHTMSNKITPMETDEAAGANLVAAGLVTLASLWALPVSTTHVTLGSIFGIGLLRQHEADWRLVRTILLSWVLTLPAGALLAAVAYLVLSL